MTTNQDELTKCHMIGRDGKWFVEHQAAKATVDDLRRQLAEVASELDEIAKRFLRVEFSGDKWGIFCDGVKPFFDTIIEACVAADEINREQLFRHQVADAKNLHKAERDLTQAREQLVTATRKAARCR